ncbi:MAG: hypothetical protein IT287_08905 [Bdellovibrionaceae bacterium]|nr:hypothetical protein [Pseudobdellovibrionaceae bacterium]
MTKRQFLFLSSAFFFSSRSWGYPITRFFGNSPDPQFLRLYFERLFKFHNQNWFPLNAHFNAEERQYIDACKETWTTWGFSVDKDHLFENFHFSHTLTNNVRNSSHLFIGSNHKSNALVASAKKIAKQRNIQLTEAEEKNFFGLQWNLQDKQLSIVSRPFESTLLSSTYWKKVISEHSADIWYPPQLLVRTFSANGTATETLHIPLQQLRRDIIPHKAMDAISAIKIISNNGTVNWHYRLKSLPHFFVDESQHPLLQKYNHDFHLYPHSLIYRDAKNFTLFYP